MSSRLVLRDWRREVQQVTNYATSHKLFTRQDALSTTTLQNTPAGIGTLATAVWLVLKSSDAMI